MRTDGQTDTRKLTVPFRNFVNAPTTLQKHDVYFHPTTFVADYPIPPTGWRNARGALKLQEVATDSCQNNDPLHCGLCPPTTKMHVVVWRHCRASLCTDR